MDAKDVTELLKSWEALEANGAKVLIWDYKKKEGIAAIYRFVVGKDAEDEGFPIYVGSGDNLSGDRGTTSLVRQYRSGNRTKQMRPKIEEEISRFANRGYSAWTEIVKLSESLRNERKVIENLIIAVYWLEYIKRSTEEPGIPELLNEKIENLGAISGLLMNLGIVGRS